MKRAIITGATGAIGTALISELVKNNIEVLVLCNRNSKRNDKIISHDLVSVISCSLEDMSELQNDLGKRYDVFYHLAWDGTTGIARNDAYLQNMNVKYAIDAVNLANRFGCEMFIGAGSQAEYGRYEGILNTELPTNPETGYGIAKLCAGHMTKLVAHDLGMKHIWVRILSIYGPNDGAHSMVSSTIKKLQNGETPAFTKAEQIWDYLYSEDAARALLLMGDKGIDGKTYILGSGNGKPLKEYIETIRNIVAPNCNLAIGEIPYAEKQVMFLCADISELKNDLGWKPRIVFSEGIKKLLVAIRGDA